MPMGRSVNGAKNALLQLPANSFERFFRCLR
jgi:hypothetical protein